MGAYAGVVEREDHRRATRVTGAYTAKHGQVTYSLRMSSTRPAAKLKLYLPGQVQKECARLFRVTSRQTDTPIVQRSARILPYADTRDPTS